VERRREAIPAQRTEHKHEGFEERHPAFGLLSLSRVNMSGVDQRVRLFGTPLEWHPHFIRLEIKRGYRVHRLGQDSFQDCGEVVSAYMSSSQLMDAFTSMNYGVGVPITLDFVAGEGPIPGIKQDEDVEMARIAKGYEDDVKERGEQLHAIVGELDMLLSKKSLNRDDKEKIRGAVHRAARVFDDSAPFVLKQFRKAARRLATAAKREVDDFLTTVVRKTGLKVLKGMSEEAGTTRWYLYDSDRGAIFEEPGEISFNIRSESKTPRTCMTDKETLVAIRGKVEKHIKNNYLKRVDAPIGVKPTLRCWMELNRG